MKNNKKNSAKQNRNNGFTLVELLVVISIIAILTIITASSFVESQKKSRDAARKANLKSLSDAINLYYADQGSFPAFITPDSELSAGSAESKVIYMKKTPIDTKAGSGGHLQFKYMTGPSRKSFKIYANLENGDDIDCKPYCSPGEYKVPSGAGCCYVVTSSNIGITDGLN